MHARSNRKRGCKDDLPTETMSLLGDISASPSVSDTGSNFHHTSGASSITMRANTCRARPLQNDLSPMAAGQQPERETGEQRRTESRVIGS